MYVYYIYIICLHTQHKYILHFCVSRFTQFNPPRGQHEKKTFNRPLSQAIFFHGAMMCCWIFRACRRKDLVKLARDLTRVFTPDGGLVLEIPLFQANLAWWNIIIWPERWTVFSFWALKLSFRKKTFHWKVNDLTLAAHFFKTQQMQQNENDPNQLIPDDK